MQDFRRRMLIVAVTDDTSDIVDFIYKDKAYLKDEDKARLLVADDGRLYV